MLRKTKCMYIFEGCDKGYFGLGCNSTCYNANCKNSSICEPIEGECKIGCIKGWTGPFCEGKG